MRPNKPLATARFILCISLIILATGCSIKKPEAPSWDTTWKIPLTSKSYFMQEIIDEIDDSLISVDEFGNPTFQVTQDFDTITVGNNLTAAAISQSYRDSLGQIDINPPADQTINLSRAGLGVPEAAGWVPPCSFTSFEDLSSLNTFTWARIENGSLLIEITNDLGIRLDTLQITLYNRGDLLSPLGMANFEAGIDQGESLSRSIDLSGDSVANQLTLKIHGAVNQPSFISGGSDNFTATNSFPAGLTVSAAMAETPMISRDFSQTIELAENSIISSAVIDSGYLNIHIANGSQLGATFELTFPNLIDNVGDTLSLDEYLAGNSAINRQIDLSGYTLKPNGTANPQSIDIQAMAVIPASAPTKILVRASDSLAVEAGVTDLVFRSVSGVIEPTQISIDTVDAEIEIPSEINTAQLTFATLDLTILNNSIADFDLDLRISDNSFSRHVDISGRIEGKSNPGEQPRATVLSLGSAELNDFLNPAPNRIIITGVSVLNPNGEYVSISKDDYFFGQITLASPLAFRLNDTTEIELDADTAEIDQEDTPDIGETFSYGSIRAVIGNRLPIGAQVSLYLSAINDGNIFDNPDAVVIGPFTLESAITDSVGQAITVVESIFEDSLSSAEIKMFDNPTIYIVPRVRLLPSINGNSYFRGSDFLSIRAQAGFKIHFGDNIWDNDN